MTPLRINCYTCAQGHQTVTIDVDTGVTPFILDCKTDGCEEMAQSSFYQPPPDCGEPKWEWYKPTTAKAQREDQKYPGMLDHAKHGGLFLRKIIK